MEGDKIVEAQVVHATAYLPGEEGEGWHTNNVEIAPRCRTAPAQLQALAGLGNLTPGLVDTVARAAEQVARRYWVVDNSGSMATYDGSRTVTTAAGATHLVQCSRWEELGASLEWHARAAAALGAWTEFRLLNDPGGGVPQQVVVGGGGKGGAGGGAGGGGGGKGGKGGGGGTGGARDDDAAALAHVRGMVHSQPLRGTPLCQALRGVAADLSEVAPHLLAAGRTASVVVASDGAASDGDVSAALAAFATLPCDVVVRLCTDDEAVVQYWNAIDEDLELSLDVLDDVKGEGAEVRALNPWIGYGEGLHRAREFGGAPKVLDLLDERALRPAEAAAVVKCILGPAADDFPHPEGDPEGYLTALKAAVRTVPPTFDASQRKHAPWIHPPTFAKKVLKTGGGSGGGGGGGCALS